MGYTGGSGIYIPSADVNFGNIGVGSSRDKNFIIYNTKSDDITIDSFSSSDDQFTVNVASFPFTIPGLSRSNTLALNFNGVTAGIYNETINLYSSLLSCWGDAFFTTDTL